jgi:7-keto-8-aminopelargonate synthetase-like enzyme
MNLIWIVSDSRIDPRKGSLMSYATTVSGPRRYRNNVKMLEVAEPAWRAALGQGLIDLQVEAGTGNRLRDVRTGHEFINMCSCSYLGLNCHPKVIAGAVASLEEAGTIGLSISPTRIRHRLAGRLEEKLGDLFGASILLGVSCSSLTAGILPLVASGHLGDGQPRVMVFDRLCHFNMSYVKPICADESLVLTSPHNDINYLEDACRKYGRVAYIADGAYSMGGTTALADLLGLQDRYGLFLYFDDSHSLSVIGKHGEGYIRSGIDINPATIIVASLGKGYGTGGGVAMLSEQHMCDFLQRNAGPVGWAQNMIVPTLGASVACAALHSSPELGELQERLQRNIAYFDEMLPTAFSGNKLPVRRITIGSAERAVAAAKELYRRGYYCSPVFFPIVPQGEAGLRVMVRADLTEGELRSLIDNIKDVIQEAEV